MEATVEGGGVDAEPVGVGPHQERAIWADSFITSPSWPVRASPGSPVHADASTNSTSPPTPVTASPVATPGTSAGRASSG